MKVIPISKKKYEELTRLRLPRDVVSTEAILYRFNYHGEEKVFKNLLKLNGVSFANKQFTLSMLDEYRQIIPESFVLPDCLCTIQGKVSGFAMPYIEGINLESYLNNKNVKNEVKLFYIKKIGEILEQLDHVRNNSTLDSIYINDLHASNFIVQPKTKELKVVDTDSCRICDSKTMPARYLSPLVLLNFAPINKYSIINKRMNVLEVISEDEDKYDYNYDYKAELGYVEANKNSDLYCYAILLLNYLYGKPTETKGGVSLMSLNTFSDYMFYLEKLGINKNLTNAFYKIISGADNENFYPYVESLTDEQVEKAKCKVFQENRS